MNSGKIGQLAQYVEKGDVDNVRSLLDDSVFSTEEGKKKLVRIYSDIFRNAVISSL